MMKVLGRVVARRAVHRANVDDVIRTALEKALRRASRLAEVDRLEASLNRIAANEAADQPRRDRQLNHAPLEAAHPITAENDTAAPFSCTQFASALFRGAYLERTPR